MQCIGGASVDGGEENRADGDGTVRRISEDNNNNNNNNEEEDEEIEMEAQ